jgi:hypothetical protein
MGRGTFNEVQNFALYTGQFIDLLPFTFHFQLLKFESCAILNSYTKGATTTRIIRKKPRPLPSNQSRNPLKSLAHPTGFEPVTSAFGARCLSAKYLNLLQRMHTNQHERIRNNTALSGNNPEAFRTQTDVFGDLLLIAWVMLTEFVTQPASSAFQDIECSRAPRVVHLFDPSRAPSAAS